MYPIVTESEIAQAYLLGVLPERIGTFSINLEKDIGYSVMMRCAFCHGLAHTDCSLVGELRETLRRLQPIPAALILMEM